MTLRPRAQVAGQVMTTQDQNQLPADDDMGYDQFSGSDHSGEETIPGMDGDFEGVAATPLNPPREILADITNGASGDRREFRLRSPRNETPDRNGRGSVPLDWAMQGGRAVARETMRTVRICETFMGEIQKENEKMVEVLKMSLDQGMDKAMKSIIADNGILHQSLQRKWKEMEHRINNDMEVLKQDQVKLERETQEARQDQLIHLNMTMREEVRELAKEWETRQSLTVTKLTNQVDQLHDKMS